MASFLKNAAKKAMGGKKDDRQQQQQQQPAPTGHGGDQGVIYPPPLVCSIESILLPALLDGIFYGGHGAVTVLRSSLHLEPLRATYMLFCSRYRDMSPINDTPCIN
eukprot:TRINITY_DN4939_c0_g1_i1.p1 TRINITY_DN4939_c0_g1~~TRINITY_DN4939_c0_g1_i1.p1  ORF type:complete len:106 (-),score=10.87 TRINITY_DN4939_c0_g1_i1:96-413(-)